MIYLQFFVLLVAGTSALFGIWTANDLVRWKAKTATGITLAGLFLGCLLAWSQHLDKAKGEEQIKQQFRALQTSTTLNNLEVRWTFSNPPKELAAAVAISQAIEHANRVSDDEFDRMPQNDISAVLNAWHVDNAVIPILVGLSNHPHDAIQYYGGEVQESYSMFGDYDNLNNVDDFDDLWFNVYYDGPTDPILLLPLNVTADGVIALGRKVDDARPFEVVEDPDNYDALWNLVASSKSYGFTASATMEGDKLELLFNYDAESLDNAVHLSTGQVRSIAHPDSFNLLLIKEGFPDEENYLDVLSREFASPVSIGSHQSTLTIVPNGLDAIAQTFDVRWVGVEQYTVDQGAYEDRIVEFEYTVFQATRR